MIEFYKVRKIGNNCTRCGICEYVNKCVNKECVGCLSCFHACPNNAKEVILDYSRREGVKIVVNKNTFEVPENVTIKRALEFIGYRFGVYPNEGDIQAPCNLGGCYTCSILVNGEIVRSCITGVSDGMKIETDTSSIVPTRIVHGPEPHTVGGKATPWTEKREGRYVEVAIWVAGCNLRCPQCQNYRVTYDNVTKPVSPMEAAYKLTVYRRRYGVKGLAVSGGEPTLNRRWLIEYFRELKKLNPDGKARLHLDSNGTLLTPSYIDELVEAGCNNIGVEPKGNNVETFKKITGIFDHELAERYLKTSWNAVKYLVDKYLDRVYVGVGIPYNSDFMSLNELYEISDKIASINNSIQVCVLDYFPTFKKKGIKRPPYNEMVKVKNILNGCGLKNVIVQTEVGYIGP